MNQYHLFHWCCDAAKELIEFDEGHERFWTHFNKNMYSRNTIRNFSQIVEFCPFCGQELEDLLNE